MRSNRPVQASRWVMVVALTARLAARPKRVLATGRVGWADVFLDNYSPRANTAAIHI
jgi:hypothetical protein